MAGENIDADRYKVEKDHFSILDELPRPIRRELANAPYPFSTVEIAVFYRRLMGSGMEREEVVQLVVARLRDMYVRMIEKEARNLYGPDHPQASRRP